MKQRTSFVANSSSSSFLICGVEISEFRKKFPDADSWYEKAEELDLMYMRDADCVGASVIYDDYGTLSEENLTTKITKAKEKMANLGFTDCQFYYGVELC